MHDVCIEFEPPNDTHTENNNYITQSKVHTCLWHTFCLTIALRIFAILIAILPISDTVLQTVRAYADWEAAEYPEDYVFKRQLVPLPRYGRIMPMMGKRQGASGLVPVPRVGRANGMLPQPRMGRAGIPQPRMGRAGMLPVARVGRANLVPQMRTGRSGAKGMLPMPRVGRSQDTAFWFATEPHEQQLQSDASQVANESNVNGNVREKRSLEPQYDLDEPLEPEVSVLNHWPMSSNRMMNTYYYRRSIRQLIPQPRFGRGGRRTSDTFTKRATRILAGPDFAVASAVDVDDGVDSGGAADPIDLQLRAVYAMPRFGKQAMMTQLHSNKRAAFTPRIGRASFTPRLGRSSWDLNVDDDELYEPRPGRAAFTPRIGRSVSTSMGQPKQPRN